MGQGMGRQRAARSRVSWIAAQSCLSFTMPSEKLPSNGLWHQLGLRDLIVLAVLSCVLLAAVLFIVTAGKPPVRVLAAGRDSDRVLRIEEEPGQRSPDCKHPLSRIHVGAIMLPLMLFHQIQLIVCAILARSYAGAPRSPAEIEDR